MEQFKATVRKFGTSHVVTIPASYIANDKLIRGRQYRFAVLEDLSQEEVPLAQQPQ